jgi:hypothetical protein
MSMACCQQYMACICQEERVACLARIASGSMLVIDRTVQWP